VVPEGFAGSGWPVPGATGSTVRTPGELLKAVGCSTRPPVESATATGALRREARASPAKVCGAAAAAITGEHGACAAGTAATGETVAGSDTGVVWQTGSDVVAPASPVEVLVMVQVCWVVPSTVVDCVVTVLEPSCVDTTATVVVLVEVPVVGWLVPALPGVLAGAGELVPLAGSGSAGGVDADVESVGSVPVVVVEGLVVEVLDADDV
jgi:hypothetical protein